jgi:hypothetical protein
MTLGASFAESLTTLATSRHDFQMLSNKSTINE